MSATREPIRRGLLASLLTACVLVAAAVACGGDESGSPGSGSDSRDAGGDAGEGPDGTVSELAWIRIGTGARQYEPLSPGQRVPIIAGPQGGYHIWGGVAGSGFDPVDATMEFVLVLDGEVIGGTTYLDDLDERPDSGDPGADWRYEYAAVAVIIRDEAPEDVSGHTVTMAVRLTARDGTELTDNIDVVPDCCQR
jgi:hypothetical protein